MMSIARNQKHSRVNFAGEQGSCRNVCGRQMTLCESIDNYYKLTYYLLFWWQQGICQMQEYLPLLIMIHMLQ